MMAKFTVVFALLFANLAIATYVPRASPGTQFITGLCQSDADCASACCGFNTGKCAGPIVAQERDGGCGFGDPQPNDNAARVFRGQSPATPTNNGGANNGTVNEGGVNNGGANNGTTNGDTNSNKCGANGTTNGGTNSNNGSTNNGGANNGTTNGGANGNNGSANNGGTTNTGSGKPPGTQFITGPCANDGECASGCCGFNTGKCAGPVIAQERDGGCGFGDAQPNDDAARKFRGLL
ncbi:hypothetical protein Moror_10612 [Moniliophthora roreri MCA 2997]|uniref:Biotrophy-associated secreted protein 2 n=1 Tax=Moniliophthora roreri (strain MCA 2997) TaxID=1381753 RepID=V2WY48_MONRO|nr:hypothetical protein Moror_10612 [Moniliophthora roreri MCA 2997]